MKRGLFTLLGMGALAALFEHPFYACFAMLVSMAVALMSPREETNVEVHQ